jgi:uncharacterized protein YdeI (YjbR/CyaY-like superfamily)
MIADVEGYFAKGCGRCARFATPDCATARWRGGLRRLRDLCRAAGLEETVKWGHPCYVHRGRNIAIFGAFRNDFRLTFLNAALLADPEGVLERAGPNSRVAGTMRFTSEAQVQARAAVIAAYLEEAKGHAGAGRKPPAADPRPAELPEEIRAALAEDPKLARAFGRLTPGRRRSYVILVSGAKRAETRRARILRARDRILAGKGANER